MSKKVKIWELNPKVEITEEQEIKISYLNFEIVLSPDHALTLGLDLTKASYAAMKQEVQIERDKEINTIWRDANESDQDI